MFFIYNSVYLLIPNFYFIPRWSSLPLVTISLFSMSVSLFLLCKFVRIIYFRVFI